MSKDLPLWENDESDIKLEHRLHYGHVLLASDDIEKILEKARAVFKLRKPINSSDEIELDWLPRKQKKGITATVLNDDKHWHFILASIKSNVAIFAPHLLFHNSTNWIKLSRKLKIQLAYVHQMDFNSYYYYVFVNGKHECNAALDQSGIHQSKMAQMEFYMNGKLFYKVDEEEDKLTPELIRFVSEDVIIDVDEQRKVRFKTPLSENEYREPKAIRHVIFPAK